MKRNFDLKILLRPYTEGEVVYLLDSASTKGKISQSELSLERPGHNIEQTVSLHIKDKAEESHLCGQP